MRLLSLSLALFVLLAAPAAAQTTYRLDPESRLWIDGTSNKSDWTVYAKALDGTVRMTAPQAVDAVELTVPAAEIVSDKSSIMDRLMHKALRVDDHPTITYELVRATVTPGGSGGFAVQAEGRLTVGGETRTITVPVQAVPLADGRVRFTGSHPLTMTDYGLDPPTAMFGALRTGDDVTVHFDLVAVPR